MCENKIGVVRGVELRSVCGHRGQECEEVGRGELGVGGGGGGVCV